MTTHVITLLDENNVKITTIGAEQAPGPFLIVGDETYKRTDVSSPGDNPGEWCWQYTRVDASPMTVVEFDKLMSATLHGPYPATELRRLCGLTGQAIEGRRRLTEVANAILEGADATMVSSTPGVQKRYAEGKWDGAISVDAKLIYRLRDALKE